MQQILFTEHIFKNKRCFQLARLYETVWAYAITTSDPLFTEEWIPISSEVFQDLLIIDSGNAESISNEKLDLYFNDISNVIKRGQERRKIAQYETMDINSSDGDLLNLAEDICLNDFNALRTFMRSRAVAVDES